MSESAAPAADWYPDPSGRFQFRYWDGETWTGHVSTDGKTDWDPPGDAAPEASAEAATGDDSAWAPQAEAEAAAEPEPAVEPAPAEEPAAAEPPAAEQPAEPVAEPEPAPAAEPAAAAEPADAATIAEDEPADTNLVANRRAGVDADVVAWLDEVAGQVEPRLSRITREWTAHPQAEAARACAYGLLVGHLARLHPHMRPELGEVAEAHPSFTTLEAGSRLDTLEQIAGDPQRATAWLGPLIGTEDVDKVTMLFD